jgi:hypothetical protein
LIKSRDHLTLAKHKVRLNMDVKMSLWSLTTKLVTYLTPSQSIARLHVIASCGCSELPQECSEVNVEELYAWALSEAANAIQAVQDKQMDMVITMPQTMQKPASTLACATVKIVALSTIQTSVATNVFTLIPRIIAGNWSQPKPSIQRTGSPLQSTRKSSQLPDGALSTKSLSSGNQARLRLIK